ncbi:hypothetical protein BS636_02180 [Acinetobacter sp. LoGeW2-3]|uniref:hypothetical protein n=1 Tax=Acinetobacter sp. LoGeW2-3 TaxID=1808001 RepID=UPI000C05AC0C|nr:hypothetical protein [Acinetobacter sp. LoGeW2-3]ATO18563.1 hypothetical protein BS636_02180 [Acinetobacter sp. LoGeW2-3]
MKTMSVFRTSGAAWSLGSISCGEEYGTIWQQMLDKTDSAMVLIELVKHKDGLLGDLSRSLSNPRLGHKPMRGNADHLLSTQNSFEILERKAFNNLNFTTLPHAENASLQTAFDLHIHDLIQQVAINGNPLNLYDHTQISVMGLKHN